MTATKELAPSVGTATACSALEVPRASFYRWLKPRRRVNRRRLPSPRALSREERETVVEVLNSERGSLPSGTTVLLVSPNLGDTLVNEIAGIRDHGFPVIVLYAGDGVPDRDIGDITVIPMASVLDAVEDREPVLAE